MASSVAPVFGQQASFAEWIAPRLSGTRGTVTGVVPDGYPAYVRLLHPVEDDEGVLHRWQEVAEHFGTRTHPLVQWAPLLGRPYNSRHAMWRDKASPDEGCLHPAALRALLTVLARHTATAENCWFAVWDGFGGFRPARQLPPPSRREKLARQIQHPGRTYALARGRLEGALSLEDDLDSPFGPQSPSLFWPDDRAWCVGTEIDFDSTLIAGTVQLADELIRNAGMETWRVEPHDSLTWAADTINVTR